VKQEDLRRARADKTDAQERAAARLSNPWRSGSFYLVAAGVLIVVMLIVAALLPIWTLPVVVIGVVVLLTLIGALQLRQDEKLNEKSFLTLVRLALAQLRLLPRHTRSPPPP
jgi:Flp pilus assembly protein TadB